LKRIFNPIRINYSCLGNFVPHVHFHLFPRYEEDLKHDETKNPWHNIDEFKNHTLGEEQAKALAKEIAREDN
jgi:diadenosine tetraphosphate (Ap4A) HIT family hydrolase